MTLTSKAYSTWVLFHVKESFTVIETSIDSQDEAEKMIAEFRDIMESFYRVWPELKDDEHNLIADVCPVPEFPKLKRGTDQ